LARGDKWHLDEVVLTINGSKHWLCQAVDQRDAVLDVLVQSRRDRYAARRFMRKLLSKHGRAPRVLITDKLKSYAAANRDMGINVEHRQHKGLNNWTEISHQPTQPREKVMRRFKSTRHLQSFASVHDQVANLFMHRRYHTDARQKRALRTQAFEVWESVTCASMLSALQLKLAILTSCMFGRSGLRLSLPTLVIAVVWMTIGAMALGHRSLESFPPTGIRRDGSGGIEGRSRGSIIWPGGPGTCARLSKTSPDRSECRCIEQGNRGIRAGEPIGKAFKRRP
jgi:hypothetical protein